MRANGDCTLVAQARAFAATRAPSVQVGGRTPALKDARRRAAVSVF
jgi:hypothetical protein